MDESRSRFSVVLASDRLFRKSAVRTAKFGPTVIVEPVPVLKLPMTSFVEKLLPTTSVPPAPRL